MQLSVNRLCSFWFSVHPPVNISSAQSQFWHNFLVFFAFLLPYLLFYFLICANKRNIIIKVTNFAGWPSMISENVLRGWPFSIPGWFRAESWVLAVECSLSRSDSWSRCDLLVPRNVQYHTTQCLSKHAPTLASFDKDRLILIICGRQRRWCHYTHRTRPHHCRDIRWSLAVPQLLSRHTIRNDVPIQLSLCLQFYLLFISDGNDAMLTSLVR